VYHLRKFKRYLHSEVNAAKVTRLFRMQRILSPKAAAETISEAHRLWVSELSAITELGSTKDESPVSLVRRRYEAELGRVDEVLSICHIEERSLSIEKVDEACYPFRLYHFEKSIQALESGQDLQRRQLEESLIHTAPTVGTSYGLYATEDGTGGIITVECSIRPMVPGEGKVSVTGNSMSAVIGQSVVSDQSVTQSAQNAAEAVLSWLWALYRIDPSQLHVHFQMRSIMEGSPGDGVSGPSAGLAMALALLSELSGLTIAPSIVATGTMGVKLDVGPVGDLGGYGTQTGNTVGILKSRGVSDLILPAAEFQSASDEMRILTEEEIAAHAVRTLGECQKTVFGADEREILERTKERFETAVRPIRSS
jgi:ATP-dependent Lon protease